MKKLLSLLTAIALTLTLAGCGEKEAPVEPVAPKNYDADVIVVGAGPAGLSAAIEAADAGAEKVILIEKTGTTGGNLKTTSGTLSGAETIIQEIDGLQDSIQSYIDDLMHEGSKNGGQPNKELVELYANLNPASIEWLWNNGLSDNEFQKDKEGHMSVFAPEHTLYSFPRSYKARPHDPKAYKSATHEILDQMLEARPAIEVKFNTEATKLSASDNKYVDTVTLKDGTSLTSKKGVVMATGGYSANPVMMGHYNELMGNVLSSGLTTTNGRGLKMMQEVGADVDAEKMGRIPTFPMGLEVAPGTGQISSTKTQVSGGILVNLNGERFINEVEADNVKREVALDEQPKSTQFEIWTDAIANETLANGSGMFLGAFFMPGGRFADHVISASSLEELASKIGVPADALVATVKDYNAHVESGETDEFGRQFTEESLDGIYSKAINKIEGDKFYALPIKALALMTVGGVEINTNAQVLDEAGEVIPGLYAAGETTAVWGAYCSGGTGVMGPVVFGRLAGQKIMSEPIVEKEIKAASNVMSEDLFIPKKWDVPEIEVDTTGLKDGVYEGTAKGFQDGLKVSVTVEGGKIAKVEVVEHNETAGVCDPAIEQMPGRIAEANDVNVDTVQGATLSSNGIKNAVANALEQAK